MWTDENRARCDRGKPRYPSDLTDEEWALIGPLIPPAKRGGNKRTVDERQVVNGLMHILSTGCRPPPTIDRLVIVAHDEDFAVPFGKQSDPSVLGLVDASESLTRNVIAMIVTV
jgi:hypothetical protein